MGSSTDAVAKQAIADVLETHLRAAATKDVALLLNVFTSDSIFVGTDDIEQWASARLAEYLEDSADGWDMSRCLQRSIFLLAGGDHAAFFEILVHQQYGTMRGSGAVVRDAEGNWKIAHYVLSFSVPNAAVEDPAFLPLLNHNVN